MNKQRTRITHVEELELEDERRPHGRTELVGNNLADVLPTGDPGLCFAEPTTGPALARAAPHPGPRARHRKLSGATGPAQLAPRRVSWEALHRSSRSPP